jgi:hypothetical protein
MRVKTVSPLVKILSDAGAKTTNPKKNPRSSIFLPFFIRLSLEKTYNNRSNPVKNN